MGESGEGAGKRVVRPPCRRRGTLDVQEPVQTGLQAPEGVSPGHVENRPGCEFLCHGDHVTLGNSLNYSEPVLCRE